MYFQNRSWATRSRQRIRSSQTRSTPSPRGKVIILDLLKHDHEEARTLYADQWLGFKEIELIEFLEIAGFKSIETMIVDKEKRPPYFETIMAIASKE